MSFLVYVFTTFMARIIHHTTASITVFPFNDTLHSG